MKEKVLLALSDANLNKILLEYLSQKGYVINSVTDGTEVIERMKTFKPDLLLIDTVLPNKSGYDVLIEKSFDKDVTKIPVVIISNSGEPIQIRQIPSTPMIKDYIIKTHVEPEEVSERIDKIFGRGIIEEEAYVEQSKVGEGKKIVWVDDDKLLSNILSKKFTSSGFSLLKAYNGEEVFKFLEKELPDIIILDLKLPDMSGLNILQKVKTDPRLKKIPVMILSNLHHKNDIENAKRLGANRFLAKAAVSPDEIISEILSLIKDSK